MGPTRQDITAFDDWWHREEETTLARYGYDRCPAYYFEAAGRVTVAVAAHRHWKRFQ